MKRARCSNSLTIIDFTLQLLTRILLLSPYSFFVALHIRGYKIKELTSIFLVENHSFEVQRIGTPKNLRFET